MKTFLYNIKKNPEEGIFYLLLLIIFFLILYIIYILVSWYFLNIKINNVDREILRIKNEIEVLKKEDDIKKYYILKTIKNDLKRTSWYEAISQIYNVYLKIISMSKWSFYIEKVDINFEKLNLEIKVDDRRTIYKKGWIIDSFLELPFIKNIKIPWYTYEDWVKFNLDANIDLNAKSKP